jgi:thymidylate synthase ThyX
MEVVMHRFVLAEFNTHRAFSRNSASSRAIPTVSMIERVVSDTALPVAWSTAKSGMRGGESHDRPELCESLWNDVATFTVATARRLTDLGVHKSVVNRLLEPFAWQTVIVTGDTAAYENFFAQRISPLAQPEIDAVARRMLDVVCNSEPLELDYGEWHTPLIQPDEVDLYGDLGEDMGWARPRVSAARCARVSYLTHAGVRDVKKDLELYDKLVSADPPHWSPLEHVCTPMPTESLRANDSPQRYLRSVTVDGKKLYLPSGNLHGWVQLRHVEKAKRS